MVCGLHPVREVVQITGEPFHLLDDTIQRPAREEQEDRSALQDVLHISAMQRGICGWFLSQGWLLQDREHDGQSPAWGYDGEHHQYLVCDVALVTASISCSFSRFSRWSCSSWSLRIS